jgi:hypothetical protein
MRAWRCRPGPWNSSCPRKASRSSRAVCGSSSARQSRAPRCQSAQALCLADLDGRTFESPGAGVFLFAPFLAQLGFNDVVMTAGLPGSEAIPAASYVVSFLALKLLGTERYAHVDDHAFDPGLG